MPGCALDLVRETLSFRVDVVCCQRVTCTRYMCYAAGVGEGEVTVDSPLSW